MKLSAVIIDDERIAIDTIAGMVSRYIPQVEIVGHAEKVSDGVEIILQTNPDLVFLDVNIADATGFDLLNCFDYIKFKVIFITAYDEFALQAIKCSALDYLLKPLDPEDLIMAVSKVEEAREKENYHLKLETFFKNMSIQGKGNKKLILNSAESIDVVEITDIIRCQSKINYTEFHLTNGRMILISKTLKEYEKLLSCEGFYRAHLSHLVNLRYVEKIDKKNGNALIMKNKSVVPLSVKNKEELLRLLESF